MDLVPARDGLRQYRWTNHLDFLYRTLHPKMCSHHLAGPFRKPANIRCLTQTYYRCPNYPLDLNTIKRRMEDNLYDGSSSAIADYRKMVLSKREFHREGSSVHKSSIALEKILNNGITMIQDEQESPVAFNGFVEDWTAKKKKSRTKSNEVVTTDKNPKLKQLITEMHAPEKYLAVLCESHKDLKDNMTQDEIKNAVNQLDSEIRALKSVFDEKIRLRNKIAAENMPPPLLQPMMPLPQSMLPPLQTLPMPPPLPQPMLPPSKIFAREEEQTESDVDTPAGSVIIKLNRISKRRQVQEEALESDVDSPAPSVIIKRNKIKRRPRLEQAKTLESDVDSPAVSAIIKINALWRKKMSKKLKKLPSPAQTPMSRVIKIDRIARRKLKDVFCKKNISFHQPDFVNGGC